MKNDIKRFYVTTPIYYANGAPHIGTAYTSLIADILARSKRILWYQVKFATGTDENGQKMIQAAAEEGKEVMEYLDDIAQSQQSTRDEMKISYTDFIRTTHPTHHQFVQKILSDVYDKWYVYQWEYEWLYCVWCEWYKKEWDLIDQWWKNVCPDHLKEPEKIKEKNWFFKLSEFEDILLKFYKEHQNFIVPEKRFNEILSFTKQWLEDFSISREGNDFRISLPENFQDPNSVVYIRFDALYNYLTVCLHPQDFTKNWQSISGEDNDMSFWNNWEVVHTMWKDISRFHGIFWPAMLEASGHSRPDTEIINGYFTVDGQKMSKSLGNKIDPLGLVEEHGRDALVYYLFSDIKIGNDGDFSRERFSTTKENVLMKWRGNLVSRVGKLCSKYEVSNWKLNIEKWWLFELAESEWLDDNKLWSLFSGYDTSVIETYLSSADYMSYLRDWFGLVQLGNQYMQQSEPRVKIKDPATEQEAIEDLQVLLRLIKNLSLLSAPFLIEWFVRVQDIIQIQDDDWKTFQTFENEDWLGEKFQRLFEMREFEVEFGEGHVY